MYQSGSSQEPINHSRYLKQREFNSRLVTQEMNRPAGLEERRQELGNESPGAVVTWPTWNPGGSQRQELCQR